jgi:lysophospholipase L1-like esterase
MIRSILLAMALAATLFAAEPAPFYLHDGDRVVFYGDSITDQRLYTLYTELYALTRYPSLNVSFVHSGWGGDRVTGGGGGPVDLRLKRDVVAYQPTVVTIMLGMNDGGYTKHKAENDDTFKTGFQHIVESLKQQIPALRITAIKPSPFDDVTRPFTLAPDGYNAILVSYGAWIDGYAKEAKIDVADLNSGVVEVVRNADLADRSNAPKIIPDRVHPGPAGHLIMAEQLLKNWNARAVVSAVTIDAGSGAVPGIEPRVIREEFAHVTGLSAEGGLRWTETEQSLPLPLAPMAEADDTGVIALALKNSDIWTALNDETLKVTGLPSGRYTLRIDGMGAGEFSNTVLQEGINLAMYHTPMTEQSMQVLKLTTVHTQIHNLRWRNVQVPLEETPQATIASALAAMDQAETDIVRIQRETAKPKAHQFELMLVPRQ